MTSTRRDLFKFAGGAAVGALFTPAPWRLVTDTALWSETWPGVPRPARGEIRAKYTNCSLCPAGCAVRARCVGEQPVALMGVLEHPFTHGALCPFGLAGHHLPYHPARISQGPVKQAAAAISDALKLCAAGERIAVLDLRPGRTASWTYRRALAQWKNGTYLALPRTFGGNLAVKLAAAKTVLSFGTPLLDGWGTPGNVIAAREGFRLIQAETVESRTAVMADQWLPIRPGSETALARAIANVLANQPLHDAALETGLTEAQIIAAARDLADNGPSLVLDARDRPEILALNQLVDSLGHTIVTRRETPVPGEWKNAVAATELSAVPDGSVRVLLIDESAPGAIPALERDRKETGRGESGGGGVRLVGRRLRAPRAITSCPPRCTRRWWMISRPRWIRRPPCSGSRLPLVPPPAGCGEPAGVRRRPGGDLCVECPAGTRRCHPQIRSRNLIHLCRREIDAVKDVKADDFWKALNEGGCWMDAVPEGTRRALSWRSARLPRTSSADSLPLAVVMTERAGRTGFADSLQAVPGIQPAAAPGPGGAPSRTVASDCGVEDGGRAILETGCGRLDVG